MKRVRIALLVLVAAFSLVAQITHAQSAPRVVVASVDGPIVSVVYDYLNRTLTTAEQDGASVYVIQLNTPGGDLNTTLRIIQRLGEARLPVIVFVSPRRAAAFSAGTLITLAGHLSVMAPETKIGAAKVIGSNGENLSSDLRDKQVNALRATVRTLTRNRKPEATDWAEKTITDAVAATEEEALKLGAIDFIANDLTDLLAQADGRKVSVSGRETTLHTANASTATADMSIGESLLYILVSPDIATLLLFVAISGLMIEFQAPGTIVGGVTVKTGDLVHADRHGVQIVPFEIARDLPAACEKIIANERKVIAFCQSDAFSLAGLKKLVP